MRRYYLPLAVLILFTAALLRFWNLHSYPPGPHYDEAANLLIARSIAYGGARFFPIVEAYQGREVIYYYLVAPLLPLLGDRMYTFHLVNAFANLVTVAAAMRLAREMFRGERGVIVALGVGIVATISFPQIFIGRQAFRAVTLPLMQALALCFLWRGLRRRGGWGWLVLGGVFAGAALYTYMASRLFPLWLAVGGLALLIFDRGQWRLRLRQGAIFFAALVVTALPIIVYALQKPDLFWGRLGEVTLPGQSISLLESVVLHLRMFFIAGDPYLRYNIPGRPYFTWPEGILLVIGFGVAAWRVIRVRRPIERTAYFLALLSPLMVIPSVVSVSGLPPSHMRSLGMIPLIFVLVGVGFEFGLDLVRRLVRLSPRVVAGGLLLTLVVSALLVGQTYFSWAGRADLYYETDADLSAAARWLATQPVENTRVYLAARDRTHPTVLIEQTPPITWLGTNTLYRAPEGADGLYIFPRSAPPPADWAAWLEAGRIDDLPLGPDGRTAFEAFRLPGNTPLPTSGRDVPGDSHNAWISLAAFYPVAIESGGSGEVVTAWQIERAPDVGDLTPLVQIETAQGDVLGRGDIYMTDTDRWEPGAVVFVRVPVTIPAGTPPGDYPVRIAWVGRASDTYAPYLKDSGGQAGIWALAGEAQVLPATQPADPDQLPIATRLDLDVAPGVRLLGFTPPADALRPGESAPVTFYWQAVPTQEERRSIEVHPILRSEDRVYDLADNLGLDTIYPPRRWRDGDVLTEYLHWEIERAQPAGAYQLYALIGDHEVLIGSLQIEGVARLYDRPDFDVEVGAEFGGVIRLVGYSIDTTNGLKLRLIWQAIQAMEQDYTVFVHLIDDHKNIVTQQDSMPVNNSYPTRLWQEGEYIVDEYQFSDVETDGLSIELGWYLQASGDRLVVTAPAIGDARDTVNLSLE
ncbi:MAG: hypothetical protein IT320_26450 [Anaerolineae bacterium]|nr:hypothetical protein [Anaerolineae bacterium]